METNVNSVILLNKAYYENCFEYELYSKIREVLNYITKVETKFENSSEKPNLEVEYAELDFLTNLSTKYTNILTTTGILYSKEDKLEYWMNFWHAYIRNYLDLNAVMEINSYFGNKRIMDAFSTGLCGQVKSQVDFVKDNYDLISLEENVQKYDIEKYMPKYDFRTIVTAIMMQAPINNHLNGQFNQDIIELYLYLFNTLNSYEVGFVTSPNKTGYSSEGEEVVKYIKDTNNYLRLLAEMAELYLNDKYAYFINNRIDEFPNYEEVRNYAIFAYSNLKEKSMAR